MASPRMKSLGEALSLGLKVDCLGFKTENIHREVRANARTAFHCFDLHAQLWDPPKSSSSPYCRSMRTVGRGKSPLGTKIARRPKSEIPWFVFVGRAPKHGPRNFGIPS